MDAVENNVSCDAWRSHSPVDARAERAATETALSPREALALDVFEAPSSEAGRKPTHHRESFAAELSAGASTQSDTGAPPAYPLGELKPPATTVAAVMPRTTAEPTRQAEMVFPTAWDRAQHQSNAAQQRIRARRAEAAESLLALTDDKWRSEPAYADVCSKLRSLDERSGQRNAVRLSEMLYCGADGFAPAVHKEAPRALAMAVCFGCSTFCDYAGPPVYNEHTGCLADSNAVLEILSPQQAAGNEQVLQSAWRYREQFAPNNIRASMAEFSASATLATVQAPPQHLARQRRRDVGRALGGPILLLAQPQCLPCFPYSYHKIRKARQDVDQKFWQSSSEEA